MKPGLIVVGVPVCPAFVVSAILFAKEKTRWSFLQLLGAWFLLVVVLTHLAEELHLLSWMGWGLPNSLGHYLDLVSAIAGLALFPVGYLLRRFTKCATQARRSSN